MKINTIKIKNFRGIPDMEISLERISFLQVLVESGKTSVLKAFNFALTGDVKRMISANRVIELLQQSYLRIRAVSRESVSCQQRHK